MQFGNLRIAIQPIGIFVGVLNLVVFALLYRFISFEFAVGFFLAMIYASVSVTTRRPPGL